MRSFYGSMLVLTFSLPAYAGSSAEYATFEASVKKLRAEIGEFDAQKKAHTFGSFMDMVDKCNPPFRKDIFDGFSNPANPESAISALNAHERDVTKHVTVADESLEALGAAAKGCVDHTTVMDSAHQTVSTAQANLDAELNLYKTKVEQARTTKYGRLKLALGMRKSNPMIVNKGVGAGDVNACDNAIKQLEQLEVTNAGEQAALTELKSSYSTRLTAIEVTAKSSANSCRSLPVQPRRAEAERPAETETASVDENTTAL